MTQVRLTLLGGVSVDVDGSGLGLAESPPAKALAALCYLAVTHKTASRRGLVEMLWPASAGDDHSANLRVALAHLRRTVPGVVEADREQLRLARECSVQIDAEEFAQLVAGGTLDCLSRAAELYAGEFMEGIDLADAPSFEEWRLAEAQRLRLLARNCLETLVEQHAALGDLARAKDYANRLTRLEPWLEAAQRRLMRLHAETGDYALALQQYQTCRAALASELGIEPSTVTTRLAERIDSARRAPQPDLPRAATPFVGRERELTESCARLLVPEVRLLTVVGVGGVGKTRLALALTERLRHRFLEGVRFVDLAEVHSKDELIEHLLDAVGSPGADGGAAPGPAGGTVTAGGAAGEPYARLQAELRGKEMLLTLDNFEQLVDEASELVAELIDSTPGLKLLVTSRVRLRVQSEWVVRLGGLEYPATGASAVRLFELAAQRGGAPQSEPFGDGVGSRVSEELEAVLRICRLVDGHPLALELAAASAAQSSAKEVADALEHGIAELTSDSRDVPARRASISAVLEQSWTKLSDADRCLLERMAVFRGGFEELAAAEVAGAEAERLVLLADRSLLQRSGERYAFHPLVREFAHARLLRSATATEETRRRHAEHFLERCREVLRNFWTLEKASYLARLSLEQDNLRAALEWATANDPEIALGMARRLWQVWMTWGQLAEGRRWLAAALEAAPADQHVDERVSVLNGAASLAYLQGDITEAVSRYEQSLALVRSLGDEHHAAIVLNNFGNLLRTMGDFEAAASRYQESLEIRRRLADTVGIASTLSNQGLLAEKRGDLLTARDLYADSLRLRRECADLGGEAIALCNLGFVSAKLGRPDEGRGFLLQALSIEQQLGGRIGASYCLLGLGNVERAAGRLGRAASLWGAAAALRKESGGSLGEEAAEHELNVATARRELGADFDESWQQGAGLSFDGIAALVEGI